MEAILWLRLPVLAGSDRTRGASEAEQGKTIKQRLARQAMAAGNCLAGIAQWYQL